MLEDYLKRHGYDDHRSSALTIIDRKNPIRASDLDFDRVVLITKSELVDSAIELASDRVARLPSVRPSHVRKAAKTILNADLTDEAVNLVVSANWSELRLAFRRGRSADDAIDRLRAASRRRLM